MSLACFLQALPLMPTVHVSPTPNPDSLKFAVDESTLIPDGLHAFASAREAEGDPLGTALFALDGVANVFIVPDFVTVTKHPAASWDRLAEAVERVLTDHVASQG